LLQLAPHYDIRQIDEDLYLAVLASRIQQDAAIAADLGESFADSNRPEPTKNT